MGLEVYNEKRDFRKTPEPSGDFKKASGQRFVIQRHQASRLHYDLRLEIDGVLKSWAIPKGPSLNPNDKRLAVQTEDHPVSYLNFEGIIPKGNYGAGKMDIWDSGEFRVYETSERGDASSQWKDGHLKLVMNGWKIRGKFTLVKTRGDKDENHWLFIKKKDSYAVSQEYDAEDFIESRDVNSGNTEKKKESAHSTVEPPSRISPMLANKRDKPFNDKNWLFEIKWDGYRMISHVIEGKVQMYSRNMHSFLGKFPGVGKELERIEHDVILDGEIIIADKDGKPDFQALQNYGKQQDDATVIYYVFDLLYLNGHYTTDLPLEKRKELLRDMLPALDKVRYTDHIIEKGKSFYNELIQNNLEGMIAKDRNSLYEPGKRSDSWLKIKARSTTDALICGMVLSDNPEPFASLVLGDMESGDLKHIGNCGTGFGANKKKELFRRLIVYKRMDNPFGQKINLKGKEVIWLEPGVICEVYYAERTSGGKLRHPSFKGLREDMEAIVEPEKFYDMEHSDLPKNEGKVEVNNREVKFTNLDKIYWPESGLRKFDLIEYYIKISEYILPYLVDRPQNLHRHPGGIHEDGFYQKDLEHHPEWISTLPVYSESSKRKIEYLLCQDESTLLYMANLGCIEINPWNSRKDDLDHPDYGVIDIDPDDKNTFDQVRETALAAKEILENNNIKACCKTTGKSGLHIYIPFIKGRYTHDESRDFIKLLSLLIHEQLPDLTSLERMKKKRKGKIYLDYLQNRRGQTLAAPYCLRPVEGAPVSTPLMWEELERSFSPADYNIYNIHERVEKNGDLFSTVINDSNDLEKILATLQP